MVRAMKATIQFRVDEKLKEQAVEKAAADEIDLADVLRDFLRDYVKD